MQGGLLHEECFVSTIDIRGHNSLKQMWIKNIDRRKCSQIFILNSRFGVIHKKVAPD